MKLSLADIQSVAADSTSYQTVTLSALSRTLIDSSYSFLYNLAFWRGADVELTDVEIDTIKAAVDAMIREVSRPSMIGAIFPFIANALPDNWLLCDGSGYLRVDYPELYAAWVGFGLITGADTFVTPDLGGHFLLPANGAFPVFSTGGEAAHILTIGEMPSHDHVVPTIGAGVVTVGAGAPAPVRTLVGTLTSNTRGGGNAHNNLPPYVALPFAVVAR